MVLVAKAVLLTMLIIIAIRYLCRHLKAIPVYDVSLMLPAIRLSLLPRSISTPFAMVISGEIGGTPELTAIFVILTGIFGASFGQLLLYWLPLKSKMSRGASFGLAAHVVGSNKAYELDNEVGTIAALVMVLTGIFNVLIAPLLETILT